MILIPIDQEAGSEPGTLFKKSLAKEIYDIGLVFIYAFDEMHCLNIQDFTVSHRPFYSRNPILDAFKPVKEEAVANGIYHHDTHTTSNIFQGMVQREISGRKQK